MHSFVSEVQFLPHPPTNNQLARTNKGTTKMKTINEEIADLRKRLDELKKQQSKGWVFVPDAEQEYWYIENGKCIGRFEWGDGSMDNELLSTGNCYPTKEAAKLRKPWLKACRINFIGESSMTENELKRCREEQKLLNCPFCGEKPILYDNYDMDGFNVSCNNGECNFQPTNDWFMKTEEDAKTAWNTRPIEAHQSALLAKAVEALENSRAIGADIVHGDITRSEAGHSMFQIAEQALAEITKGDKDAK